jgi:hypothetical protein
VGRRGSLVGVWQNGRGRAERTGGSLMGIGIRTSGTGGDGRDVRKIFLKGSVLSQFRFCTMGKVSQEVLW